MDNDEHFKVFLQPVGKEENQRRIKTHIKHTIVPEKHKCGFRSEPDCCLLVANRNAEEQALMAACVNITFDQSSDSTFSSMKILGVSCVVWRHSDTQSYNLLPPLTPRCLWRTCINQGKSHSLCSQFENSSLCHCNIIPCPVELKCVYYWASLLDTFGVWHQRNKRKNTTGKNRPNEPCWRILLHLASTYRKRFSMT